MWVCKSKNSYTLVYLYVNVTAINYLSKNF